MDKCPVSVTDHSKPYKSMQKIGPNTSSIHNSVIGSWSLWN